MSDVLEQLFDGSAPPADDAEAQNRLRVDWEEAPYIAGGYIAVNVDEKIHACWVLDPDLEASGKPRRVWAPTFGVSVPLGGVWSMLRPPVLHPCEPWAMGAIRAILEKHRQKQLAKLDLITLPSEPGFRRRKEYPRNELSMRIAVGLDAQNVIAGIRTHRASVQSVQPEAL